MQKIRLARLRVRSVTVEAVFRKYGPDIAIEGGRFPSVDRSKGSMAPDQGKRNKQASKVHDRLSHAICKESIGFHDTTKLSLCHH